MKRVLRLVVLPLAALLGCAQPVAGLWPPGPGEATHEIVVSTDAWHSVVALPRERPGGPVEEWGYADKAHYLEGHDGVLGTLDALFVPGAAVVVVTHADRIWAERSPQPPGRSWTFALMDAGYAGLLGFLHGELASPEVISDRNGADWYDAKSSYHAFHHCHHWTAAALREAGLPVWPAYALFKWSLEAQLDRAEEIARQLDDERR
jgi:hypothetical protein